MKKLRKFLAHRLLVSIAGGLLLSNAAQADVSQYFGIHLDAETKEHLAKRIKKIQGNPEKAAVLKEKIRHRTVVRKTCHGEDGKAVTPEVPNLAAQNMDYLIDQMIKYRRGLRYDSWMTALAKGFSDDDIVNIAIKYSTMPPLHSDNGDKTLISQGEKVFVEHCNKCHGADGTGNEGYARLAGQPADYVVKILKGFRESNGRRANPWMTVVSMRLSDAQMEAVASYVSHLK